MVIEINSDGIAWGQVKHALREAGYKVFLQPILFDDARANLFLEPRSEPEGGELKHGLLVFPGGCQAGSHSERVIENSFNKTCPIHNVPIVNLQHPMKPLGVIMAQVCPECQKEPESFAFQEKPAAKSSTNVLNASVCQSCGCKLDGQPLKKICSCRCHIDGVR